MPGTALVLILMVRAVPGTVTHLALYVIIYIIYITYIYIYHAAYNILDVCNAHVHAVHTHMRAFQLYVCVTLPAIKVVGCDERGHWQWQWCVAAQHDMRM